MSTSAKEEPQTIVNIPQYPCDRGDPSNVVMRGWHRFEAGASGVVVCIYCGQRSTR